jgi:tetratricopeptide (TPR) repeat protein
LLSADRTWTDQSLQTKGRLRPHEPIVVADFTADGGADSSLGAVLAEAVREDLRESNVVTVLPTSLVHTALRHMGRRSSARLDAATARIVAERSGSRAVIDGTVTQVGSAYIITERVVAAESGDELATYQAAAKGPDGLIPAIDEATRALRRRIGESLRSVRANPPLAQVSTPSIDALRKYQQGVLADEERGDYVEAVADLRDAVTIDTSFAMAWRKLRAALGHARYPDLMLESAAVHAYANSSHLTRPEQLAVEGDYHTWVTGDRAKAADAYEALIAYGLPADDRDLLALTNNLGVIWRRRRQYDKAEFYLRSVLAHERVPQSYAALIDAFETEDKVQAADSLLEDMRRNFPTYYRTLATPGLRLAAAGRLDSAYVLLAPLAKSGPPARRLSALEDLAALQTERGQLGDAGRLRAEHGRLLQSMSAAVDSLSLVLGEAESALTRGDTLAALRSVESFLQHTKLASYPRRDQPYYAVADFFARAGSATHARAIVSLMDTEVKDSVYKRWTLSSRHSVLSEIAITEKDAARAIMERYASDSLPDGPPATSASQLFAGLGRAFQAAGQTDSAIVYFERYLATPLGLTTRLALDANRRPGVELRLAQLYDARHDEARATDHYRRWLELWRNADTELQPRVSVVRHRLAELTRSGR